MARVSACLGRPCGKLTSTGGITRGLAVSCSSLSAEGTFLASRRSTLMRWWEAFLVLLGGGEEEAAAAPLAWLELLRFLPEDPMDG